MRGATAEKEPIASPTAVYTAATLTAGNNVGQRPCQLVVLEPESESRGAKARALSWLSCFRPSPAPDVPQLRISLLAPDGSGLQARRCHYRDEQGRLFHAVALFDEGKAQAPQRTPSSAQAPGQLPSAAKPEPSTAPGAAPTTSPHTTAPGPSFAAADAAACAVTVLEFPGAVLYQNARSAAQFGQLAGQPGRMGEPLLRRLLQRGGTGAGGSAEAIAARPLLLQMLSALAEGKPFEAIVQVPELMRDWGAAESTCARMSRMSGGLPLSPADLLDETDLQLLRALEDESPGSGRVRSGPRRGTAQGAGAGAGAGGPSQPAGAGNGGVAAAGGRGPGQRPQAQSLYGPGRRARLGTGDGYLPSRRRAAAQASPVASGSGPGFIPASMPIGVRHGPIAAAAPPPARPAAAATPFSASASLPLRAVNVARNAAAHAAAAGGGAPGVAPPAGCAFQHASTPLSVVPPGPEALGSTGSLHAPLSAHTHSSLDAATVVAAGAAVCSLEPSRRMPPTLRPCAEEGPDPDADPGWLEAMAVANAVTLPSGATTPGTARCSLAGGEGLTPTSSGAPALAPAPGLVPAPVLTPTPLLVPVSVLDPGPPPAPLPALHSMLACLAPLGGGLGQGQSETLQKIAQGAAAAASARRRGARRSASSVTLALGVGSAPLPTAVAAAAMAAAGSGAQQAAEASLAAGVRRLAHAGFSMDMSAFVSPFVALSGSNSPIPEGDAQRGGGPLCGPSRLQSSGVSLGAGIGAGFPAGAGTGAASSLAAGGGGQPAGTASAPLVRLSLGTPTLRLPGGGHQQLSTIADDGDLDDGMVDEDQVSYCEAEAVATAAAAAASAALSPPAVSRRSTARIRSPFSENGDHGSFSTADHMIVLNEYNLDDPDGDGTDDSNGNGNSNSDISTSVSRLAQQRNSGGGLAAAGQGGAGGATALPHGTQPPAPPSGLEPPTPSTLDPRTPQRSGTTGNYSPHASGTVEVDRITPPSPLPSGPDPGPQPPLQPPPPSLRPLQLQPQQPSAASEGFLDGLCAGGEVHSLGELPHGSLYASSPPVIAAMAAPSRLAPAPQQPGQSLPLPVPWSLPTHRSAQASPPMSPRILIRRGSTTGSTGGVAATAAPTAAVGTAGGAGAGAAVQQHTGGPPSATARPAPRSGSLRNTSTSDRLKLLFGSLHRNESALAAATAAAAAAAATAGSVVPLARRVGLRSPPAAVPESLGEAGKAAVTAPGCTGAAAVAGSTAGPGEAGLVAVERGPAGPGAGSVGPAGMRLSASAAAVEGGGGSMLADATSPAPTPAPVRLRWQKIHAVAIASPCGPDRERELERDAREDEPSGRGRRGSTAANGTGTGSPAASTSTHGRRRQITITLTQIDVTEQVEAQARLTRLLEQEHKVLEKIFPRHVLEHLTITEAMADPGSGPGGAASSSSLLALRRPGSLERMASLATWHPGVTILFADIVGFTSMCHAATPLTVMAFLNQLYSRFDAMIDIYKVYKVETIGDCYMVAGGVVAYDDDGYKSVISGTEDALHAVRAMEFAKAMLRASRGVRMPHTGEPVQLRIGLHSGPVTSGVVGDRMPRFCLFGDTVNTASRMESTCRPGCIHVSEATRQRLPSEAWTDLGMTEVKGKGEMRTFEWAGDVDAPFSDGQLQRVLGLYL
ncbi:hypothetical protein HYH03_017500 [Edaphochlamys debaryana]|uniref:Guanylate cyclase domain-containing protein n=1 Tax=Edaphochlamys debaryana TaxID=47281 RepID=A0A835XMC9_9CHLO|nr:hypothetical protein HYH03_017500 [Edaphochlamys debaryana]|eukprot:KAG2483620.1 hypothetical protein HYH03_017500 [Edaphochlamys debaryana]